jgi:hypothetical protein
MTLAEQIYLLVKTLPPEQAGEVLTFAEFIVTKHQNVNQSISQVAPIATGSVSFKNSLTRLYDLTQDCPSADPVALIQEGREALNERGCF